jgi:N-acetyl-anhydromuramyl-L-alanine amidase AmpD
MARYSAVPYIGPPRSYGAWETTKTGIAIHATANTASAENEASYARNRTDSVSSHFYVDDNSVIQSLDTKFLAWHAGNDEGNSRAVAIEITGQNAWTRQRWLDSVDWNGLAKLCAWICIRHNIAPRHLTVAQMQSGAPGIYTHNDMRLAWGGTDHTDPGPNFPMDYLLTLVSSELEDDMEQTDKLQAKTANAGRSLADTWGDLSNFRDFMIGEIASPTGPSGGPVSPKSPIGKLLALADRPAVVPSAAEIAAEIIRQLSAPSS